MPRRQRMTTSRAESAITTPRFRSARTQTESSGFNERSSSRLWSNHENQTDRRIYDLAVEFLCYRAADCRHARSDSYGDEHCPTGLRAGQAGDAAFGRYQQIRDDDPEAVGADQSTDQYH